MRGLQLGCCVCLLAGLAGVAIGGESSWTPEERARGFVPCTRSYLAPFFTEDVPAREEIARELSVALARDEYEPVMLGVHAIEKDLADVSVEVSTDLPVTVYRFAPKRRSVPGRGEVGFPCYLLPGRRIDAIGAGRTGVFWILLRAEKGAAAGAHREEVILSVAGGKKLTLPLAVTVRPFALPRPNIPFGMYFSMNYFPADLRSDEYKRMYYRDMVAHGMTSCTLMPTALAEFTGDTAKRTGTVKFDTWPAGRDIEMMKQEGLLHVDLPAMLLDGRVGEAADKRRVAADLKRECEKRGWPELVLYMRDEPGWKQFEELTPWLTEWKKIPEARNVTAMNSQPPYGLGYIHDVWVVRNDEITRELVREAHRLGCDVWTYAIDLAFTNPLANRYYAGIYTWAFGLGGNFPWAYHDRQHVYLAENGQPTGYPPNGFIIPSKDGPCPSVGWEGRREGVDDYRYILLLETILEKVDANESRAAAAREWLNALRNGVGWNFYQGGTVGHRVAMDLTDPAPQISLQDWEHFRPRCAGYIEELLAKVETIGKPVRHVVPKAIVGKYEPAPFVDKTVAECIAGLRSERVADRRAAASALALRKSEAAPAVDALVALLDDPDVRMPALRAIDAIGPEAAPAIGRLVVLLEDEDPTVRMWTTFALSGIGKEAVDALVKALDDEAWYVARLASDKLGVMGPEAKAAAPALAKQVSHSNGDCAYWATKALEQMGPDAAEAVPALLKALSHPTSAGTRHGAAGALGAIGPKARRAIPALEKAAGGSDVWLVSHARLALVKLRTNDDDVRALFSLFADCPVVLRRRLAGWLASMPQRCGPIKGDVRKALDVEKDKTVKTSLQTIIDQL